MEHEHIVASGIYYVAVSDNINNNYLSFRQAVDEDFWVENQEDVPEGRCRWVG